LETGTSESTTIRKVKSNDSGEGMVEVHTNKAGIMKKHKIVIIRDSHSRGQAKEVKNHLNKNFEVIGLVKPGAGREILVNSAKSDTMNLTKNDAVVFCGGSNYVSKNNTNAVLKKSQILLRQATTQTSFY
jgi:hypothetical protein